MYSPTRDPASTKSEVFYWQLLGLQVFIVYGLIAVAFFTRSLSIRDDNFDATVLTVTVIFVSTILHMPQTKTLNFSCLDCSRYRKKKWSNAKYRFFLPPASPLGFRPPTSGRPSMTDLTFTPKTAASPQRQKHPTGGASAGSGHNPALRGPQSPGNFCATNPAIFPPKGNVDYYGKMRHGNADTSWERTAPADHCTSYRKPTWSVRETQAHCRP